LVTKPKLTSASIAQQGPIMWVDVGTYEGPDRRLAQRWRLIDRRAFNEARKPPSLETKLRQLRVKALNTATREARAEFAAAARAASLLAELHDRNREAFALNHLAAQVCAMPLSVHLSDWLDRELEAVLQRSSSPLG
jgi:hypothetical protein